MSAQDEFERKNRCASYWNQAGKEIDLEFSGVARPPAVGPLISELFYSPTLNTCVIAFEITNPHLYYIKDVLTRQMLFNEVGSDVELKHWKDEIAELKKQNKYTVEEVK